jgi:hypothetical protein
MEEKERFCNDLPPHIRHRDGTNLVRATRFGDSNHSILKPHLREPTEKEEVIKDVIDDVNEVRII